jgi:hypothetical protein
VEIGDGLIAHLRVGVRRHQTPWLPDRPFELREGQRAAGEIRAPAALPGDAVTKIAHLPLPKDLARIGLTGRSLLPL